MIRMWHTNQPPSSSHLTAISEGEKAYLDDKSGGDVLNYNGNSQWRAKGTKNNEEDKGEGACSRRQTEKSKAQGEEKEATTQPACMNNE